MTETDILRLFDGQYPVSAAINDVHGTPASGSKPAVYVWRHAGLANTFAEWVREGMLQDADRRESPLTGERIMGFLLELTAQGRERAGLPPLIPVVVVPVVVVKKSKKLVRLEMSRNLFDDD